MFVASKSQVKSVARLLELVGKKSPDVKRLSEKKPVLFQTLFGSVEYYRPVNHQTRLSSIMVVTLLGNDSETKVLMDLENVFITKEPGGVIALEVASMIKLRELEDPENSLSPEEALYLLLTGETSVALQSVEEKSQFTRCVFLNHHEKVAHCPMNRENMDSIKESLGFRSVFADMHNVTGVRFKTERQKTEYLFGLTCSLLQSVNQFLDPLQGDAEGKVIISPSSSRTIEKVPKSSKSLKNKHENNKDKNKKKSKKHEKKHGKKKEKKVKQVKKEKERKKRKLSESIPEEIVEPPITEKPQEVLPELKEVTENAKSVTFQVVYNMPSIPHSIDRDTSDFASSMNWFYKNGPFSL